MDRNGTAEQFSTKASARRWRWRALPVFVVTWGLAPDAVLAQPAPTCTTPPQASATGIAPDTAPLPLQQIVKDVIGSPDPLEDEEGVHVFWFEMSLPDEPRPPQCRYMTPDERRQFAADLRSGLEAVKQGRAPQGQPQLMRARRLLSETYGPGHHYLIGIVALLRDVYQIAGQRYAGLIFYRYLVDLCTLNYGFQNQCTWNARINLEQQVPHAAAEEFGRRVAAQYPNSRLTADQSQRLEALQRILDAPGTNDRVRLENLLERLAIEQAVFGEGNRRSSEAHYLLAHTYWRLGDNNRALSHANAAIEGYRAFLPAEHPYLGDAEEHLGRVYSSMARHAEALPHFYAAFRHREANFGVYYFATLHSQDIYAATLQNLGRTEEAAAAYRTHRERSLAVNGAEVGFAAEVDAARRKFTDGDERAGIEAVEAAIRREQASRGPKDVQNFINAHALLGHMLLENGQHARAVEVFEANLGRQRQEAPENIWELIIRLDDHGIGLFRAERFAEAEPLFEESLAISVRNRGRDSPSAQRERENLIATRLKIPSRAHLAMEVARDLRAVVREELRSLNFDLNVSEDLPALRASRSSMFEFVADAAWAARPRPDTSDFDAVDGAIAEEAFEALQEAMLGSSSEAIIRMVARDMAAARSPDLATLVAERHGIAASWSTLERERAKLAAAAATDAAAVSRNAAKTRELTARLSQIDDRLRAQFPQFFELSRPVPLRVQDARRLVRDREAILMIIPTETGTHLMAITEAGLRWKRSAMTSSEVVTAAASLRNDLAPTSPGGGPETSGLRSFNRALAHELYKQLIAPLQYDLAGRRLTVITGPELASLPLSVLVTAAPSGDDSDPDALRATAWLAERHAVSYVPSLQTLSLLRSASRASDRAGEARSARPSFVGFGDPYLSGAPRARGGPASAPPHADPALMQDGRLQSSEVLNQLHQLPGTAVELRIVAERLGAPASSLYLRRRAAEDELQKSGIGRADIVAFATHGVLPDELGPGIPAGLVLTPPSAAGATYDGFLTIAEIARMPLAARLVILSACNSASSTDNATNGLNGLSQAFLFAGARSVMASHWPVRDDVAPRLVTAMVARYVERGLSRSAALQEAVREVRNDRGDDSFAHPSAWAPFVIIGED